VKAGIHLPEIAARSEELDKCVNCGLCQAVCPTYLVDGFEGLTARGKIVMMKRLLDGSLEPSSSVAELFDDCLTCYACQTVCPAGVKTQRLWTAARQDLAEYTVKTRLKRAGLRLSIGSPRLFNLAVRMAGMTAGFRLDNRHITGQRRWLLPIFRGAPYLPKLRTEYHPSGESVGTVGLLVGCSSNLTTPWVVDAVIKLLTRAGWKVLVPKEQLCCGAPAINNGDWQTARRLARHNIELFNRLEVDFITSPDATCVGAMEHDYPEIFAGDDRIVDEVRRLADRAVELGRLLFEALKEGRLNFRQLEASVTLHDSCHSTHIGGGGRWRELLGAIEGLELREMLDSDHCCGFGGSYTFLHHSTAVQIARRKLSRARETGADTVLVGSPGCLVSLQSAADRQDRRDPEIRHAAELLAEAL